MTPEFEPCPFCGGEASYDSDAVTTTFDGPAIAPTGWHERQSGWGECTKCGATGPAVHAKDEEINRLREMIANAWNTRPLERQARAEALAEVLAKGKELYGRNAIPIDALAGIIGGLALKEQPLEGER